MAKIVLLHGAWHGSWCFSKLEQELKNRGFEVELVDYPGHGEDHTPREELSIGGYIEKVTDVLKNQTEPVVFAVHSFGGMIGSQAVENAPENVKALVYIAAFLPCNGDTAMVLNRMIPDPPVNAHLCVDGGFCYIDSAAAKDMFYNDCSEEDAESSVPQLTVEPLSVWGVPLNLTEERFGSMPHYYVHTLQDKTIPIGLQRMWCDRAGMKNTFELDSSHSPFLSMPDKLADVLEQIANTN